MISCDAFRTRFHAATENPALLDHIRTCDRCLDFAAQVDPDVMFRALGGSDMIPPGGVDAFVDDVMRQVRVRGAEAAIEPPHVMSWSRRLAVAATVAITVTGATLIYRFENAPVAAPQLIAAAKPVTARILTTKPVVETYESQNATIVEVPSDEAGDDVKIVMIFDDNLPADL
jgi:hypothetical protein